MHSRLLASAAVVCVGAGALPATAAASQATRADQAALGAYRTYLNASVNSLTAATKNGNGVVSNVQTNCNNALSALNNVTATKKVQSAVTNYGHEIDADLTLAWLAPTKAPLNTFAAALNKLHWGNPSAARTATALISAERALLSVPSSNLCQNAFRLAGHPATTPSPTSTFLNRYDKAHAALMSAESAFGALLRKYAPTSTNAANLLSQDQSLESQYSSASSSAEQSAANSILSELGFS